MDRFSYKNGKLRCENAAVDDLARAYGTPLYVYSKGTFADHFHRLDDAFDHLDHMICYAVKANSNLSVLRIFIALGAGFDIVSAGELYRVVKAGGDSRRAVFAGIGKTEDEIRFALQNEIRFFSVESEVELRRINAVAGRINRTARFCVRVNPDVDPRTHRYITTGKSENKFGLDFEEAKRLYACAKDLSHVKAVGVQMHIGSQITTTAPYVTAIGKLAGLVSELRAQGVEIDCVDIGGGMGIIYDNETPPTADAFAAAITPTLASLEAEILFEPGRFLVGNGGILVTQVQYIKKTPAREFVIVDAGMNDLIRPSLYQAYHEIVPVVEREGEARIVDVVGPICESGDFLGLGRSLPPVEPGDFLAVRSAGAYGFVMSSNYNSRPRAAEVLVDGGEARVGRKRETWDDLIALEAGRIANCELKIEN